MKALLLRVGIDKGVGNCHAPIFEDGSFEYIPIPERCATSVNRTYVHLSGKNYKSLADFVPPKLHYSVPHVDPEFDTFTYGDPTPNKRRQLAKLAPDDLLVFYAGLEPRDGIDSNSIRGEPSCLTRTPIKLVTASAHHITSSMDEGHDLSALFRGCCHES